MADKPVTGLTVFGSNTTGTTTQLDNNFSAITAALNDFNTYDNYLADTGAANAISVTLPANITGALGDGLMVQVKIAADNTGATVMNYNATGNANVVNVDGSALTAGQLKANGIVQMQYSNGISGWYLQTPAGSGALVLIQSNQAANSNAIFFNNLITSSYDNYVLKASGVKLAGNGSSLSLRVGNSNAPTFQSTNYQWSGTHLLSSGVGSFASSGANSLTTALFLTSVLGVYNGANASLSSTVNLSVVQNANGPAPATVQTEWVASLGTLGASFYGGGYWDSNQVVTSLQVVPSNANITSGNFALYGVRR